MALGTSVSAGCQNRPVLPPPPADLGTSFRSDRSSAVSEHLRTSGRPPLVPRAPFPWELLPSPAALHPSQDLPDGTQQPVLAPAPPGTQQQAGEEEQGDYLTRLEQREQRRRSHGSAGSSELSFDQFGSRDEASLREDLRALDLHLAGLPGSSPRATREHYHQLLRRRGVKEPRSPGLDDTRAVAAAAGEAATAAAAREPEPAPEQLAAAAVAAAEARAEDAESRMRDVEAALQVARRERDDSRALIEELSKEVTDLSRRADDMMASTWKAVGASPAPGPALPVASNPPLYPAARLGIRRCEARPGGAAGTGVDPAHRPQGAAA